MCGLVRWRDIITLHHVTMTLHQDIMTSSLSMRPTHLCLPRQLAQVGHQGRRHLLRAPLEESAAAAEEQSVTREHQLVLSLEREREILEQKL